MDLLRNLGSAAVSSLVQKSGLNLPFTLGEKVAYLDGKSIWTLYDATKRDDGSQVSVFYFDANSPPRRDLLPLAKNALRKLRTVRHPDVLKFIDTVETDTTVHVMTERVKPLGSALKGLAFKTAKEKEDWLVWGLQRLSTALAFVNDSCSSTHGSVRVDSVFLSPSGEWKLGGFDLLSNAKEANAVLYYQGHLLPDARLYASPEVQKEGWSTLKEHHPSVADGYALGLLIFSIFNPTLPLPHDSNHSTRGAIPTSIFPYFKKLLSHNPKARLSPSAFLEAGMTGSAGFFINNKFVSLCTGLDQFGLSGEAERAGLLRTLKESAPSLPPEFACHRVLPSLISALEYGGANASTILPLVLQMGVHVPSAEYSSIVLTPIAKLFASPDRGTRMALLDNLGEYADKMDQKYVADKVWPHLQTGFADTVPVIREATVKAIGLLHTKFNERILNNDLLRHLAKMQMDPEASIRTNTCILIGRMGPSLGYNTKRKVLIPAFARALKDTFVHARVAGLMAFMATIECFDADDMAGKVLPCISFTLVDKEKLVRDQAFKAVELFVKKLESHVATMPETAIHENGIPFAPAAPIPGAQNTIVNSATGAAGALAGWAISSLSKKLSPGDLSSTMSTLDRSLSPSTASPDVNGRAAGSKSPSLVVSPPDSRVSSPGPSFKPASKSMQLGGTAKSKPSSTSVHLSLAAELASEFENGDDAGGAAWGDDDLMDVNADEDDWTAFETAPQASNSKTGLRHSSTGGLGFGELAIPMANTPTIGINDDDWGDIDPSAKPTTSASVETWNANYVRPPSPPLPHRSRPASPATTTSATIPQKPKLQQTSSIRSVSTAPTTPVSTIGTPHASPPLSTATMSKEEKAAEMARRKEERKLRIAQLKEHKKQHPVSKS